MPLEHVIQAGELERLQLIIPPPPHQCLISVPANFMAVFSANVHAARLLPSNIRCKGCRWVVANNYTVTGVSRHSICPSQKL